MKCRNKKCLWWSDFPTHGCKGVPTLVQKISECFSYQEYEAKQKEIKLKENLILKAEVKNELAENEVTNSILSLEL